MGVTLVKSSSWVYRASIIVGTLSSYKKLPPPHLTLFHIENRSKSPFELISHGRGFLKGEKYGEKFQVYFIN